jgi:hypothetical protein
MAGAVLSTRALNRALLARQFLLARTPLAPVPANERLAGLQAQDMRPPFVNLWSRLEGFRREALTEALASRQVVRGSLMRGTLHMVSAADYLAWRMPLQARMTAGVEGILKNRRMTADQDAVMAVAAPLFRERPRTFAEIRAALVEAFPGQDERALGFTARMNLQLVAPPEAVEWAFRRDPIFALAEDWLGTPIPAATEPDGLVLRYLAAFGPSTVADAQAWSGLAALRPAFERLSDRLVRFRDERRRELFDLPDAPRPPEDTPAPVRLLDGFDGVMLGHAERARIMDPAHRPRIANKNLRIPPVFLADGFVAGTWATTISRKTATLAFTPFAKLTRRDRDEAAAEGERLLAFLAPDISSRTAAFA